MLPQILAAEARQSFRPLRELLIFLLLFLLEFLGGFRVEFREASGGLGPFLGRGDVKTRRDGRAPARFPFGVELLFLEERPVWDQPVN